MHKLLSRQVWLGLSGLVLSACSMIPGYERPPAPVPQAFPGSSAMREGVVAPDMGWAEFFADERLRGLIAAALTNNRDLRLALSRVSEARAQLGITEADRLPNVDAVLGSTTNRASRDLVGAAGRQVARRSDLNVSLLSFELDFWGRVRALTEAAKASYLASEEGARAIRLSLIGDVATAYYTLIEFEQRIALTQAALTARAAQQNLTARRAAIGIASDLDRLQAEASLESARAELAALLRQRDAARNALNLLAGYTTEMPAGRLTEIAQPGAARPLPGLAAESLLARPDVAAAEQRLLATNASIGAARAAFFPRIVLTGAFGNASRQLDNLFDDDSRAWSFLPQIRLPLFDAGRNAANLSLAEARKVSAVVDYERTLQQAFREVADALSARAALRDEVEAREKTSRIQSQRLALAEKRYRVGLVSFLDVLDAQRESYAAEQAWVQSLRQQITTEVLLYKALGGGVRKDEKVGAS